MAVIVHGPTPTVIHPVSPKTLLNYFFSAQKIKEGREIRTLGFFFLLLFPPSHAIMARKQLPPRQIKEGREIHILVCYYSSTTLYQHSEEIPLPLKKIKEGRAIHILVFFFLLKPCQYGEDKKFFLFSTQRI